MKTLRISPGMLCIVCGASVNPATRRKTCGDECRARHRSLTMAQTNKSHASERMKAKNPMRDESTRARMGATLRAIGHRPAVRGGNGTPLPAAQSAMLQALKPLSPVAEFVVRTGMWRGREGLPNHFKIDIALPSMKVAVEIDGGSHASNHRKAQDAKKTAYLSASGWTVLRFSNRDVMERLADCALMVTSTTSRLTG